MFVIEQTPPHLYIVHNSGVIYTQHTQLTNARGQMFNTVNVIFERIVASQVQCAAGSSTSKVYVYS